VNGDQFAVHFKMDVTPEDTGKRTTMDEVGIYTVRNDRIAEERFFYGTA
jgi:ketosteroid isomerase-like protein